MDTVNPGLEPRSKLSWEDVIIRTPWLSKRLHSMTTGQEQTIRHQALPMPGESSELEVLSEKLYTEYCKKLPSSGGGKSPLGRAGTLRLHLKKAESKPKRYRPGCWKPKSVPQGSILQIKAGKIRPAQPFPSHQRVVRAGRGTARGLRLRGHRRNQSTARPRDCSGSRKHSPGGCSS